MDKPFIQITRTQFDQAVTKLIQTDTQLRDVPKPFGYRKYVEAVLLRGMLDAIDSMLRDPFDNGVVDDLLCNLPDSAKYKRFVCSSPERKQKKTARARTRTVTNKTEGVTR